MSYSQASIQNFLSNLDSHGGPAKSERNFVQITPPTILSSLSGGLERDLQYQCDSSELPGIALDTADYRIYGYTKKIAIGRVYSEIVLTLYCTNDFYEKPFFDGWVETVNGEANGWDFNYKDDYVGTLNIYQFDQNQNIIYAVSCLRAFPVHVAALPTRWADDSIHKLSVTFVYDRYKEITTSGTQTSQITPQFIAPVNSFTG